MGQYLEIIRRALEEIEAERSRKDSRQGHDVRLDGSALPGESIMALKVWSDVLGAEVWVVADDLPAGEWPNDAPAYRRSEVKILTEVGHDTLAWVHPAKAIFNARVVEGPRREGAT